ncbi:alpha/beta-hydrolase [Periconia macrospinosa]|uniref:Alpha/beta-hydrolase n=1 Tax=Periconia macrospinosa TaxID=97972 RepID=A0A2V1D3Q2_9PLEO|nr:alpha/beta-hydrolase [Periconia macrospinosa]
MAHLQKLGTSIADQIYPTFAHYAPLLRANASTIRSTTCSTFTYGPSPRHKLDVYTPLRHSTTGSRHSVLLFFYGGGFVQGHRTLPLFALDGLVHANLASFFVQKYGYTVVVPDYRLLSHGAEFPSGGEDVALTMQWVYDNVDKLGPVEEESRSGVDLFILGNSAGGVHVSTFLFCDTFSKARADMLNVEKTKLRGVVLLSVPFSYGLVQDWEKREVLDQYFRDAEQNCPLALLKDTRRSNPGGLDFAKAGTRILVLNAEWDPEDECLRPRDEFVQEWWKFEDSKSRCALAVDSVLGQNHISPFLSLSTNMKSEEAWGHLVANFCNRVSQ